MKIRVPEEMIYTYCVNNKQELNTCLLDVLFLIKFVNIFNYSWSRWTFPLTKGHKVQVVEFKHKSNTEIIVQSYPHVYSMVGFEEKEYNYSWMEVVLCVDRARNE